MIYNNRMEDSGIEQARVPTRREKRVANRIVRKALGRKATGEFWDAPSVGVKGDRRTYGYAVLVTDPNFTSHEVDFPEYMERLDRLSSALTGRLPIISRVVTDITGDSFHQQPPDSHLDIN